jgi:hypothetical protein
MEQPDLFSYNNEDDDYYRRLPAPSVEDSPTSAGRAKREDDSGKTSQRQKEILKLLAQMGTVGGTWKEVGDRLGLHHGQSSGALSTLHSAGLVFALKTPRDNCQPYVHAKFRANFSDASRNDKPATTKSGRKRASLNRLHETVSIWLAFPTEANLEAMREAKKDADE